jgi:DNA-binding transcriptional MocR family regulator
LNRNKRCNNVERQALSIRKFAEVCGVSHTEIARRMKELSIEGTPQGKGLPTLLSPTEQDAIAAVLFVPAEPPAAPSQQVEVIGGGLSVYQVAPLATRGIDSSLSRNLQTQQLTQALGAFKGNQAGFRTALLGMASESGRQLGHEMLLTEMNTAMATHAELQQQVGKELGVVADAPVEA